MTETGASKTLSQSLFEVAVGLDYTLVPFSLSKKKEPKKSAFVLGVSLTAVSDQPMRLDRTSATALDPCIGCDKGECIEFLGTS